MHVFFSKAAGKMICFFYFCVVAVVIKLVNISKPRQPFF